MMPESGTIFVPTSEGGALEAAVTNGGTSGMNTTAWRQSVGGVVCNTPDLSQMAAKIDSLKKWTVTTYKTTKQSICENLGKVERTVDRELEDQIESLKDLHRRYNQVYLMSKLFNSHFHQLNETQKNLAESLYQLSLKENSLQSECTSNSESLRLMAHNGELLERALSFFLSSMKTLCEKTIEDTLLTVHNHDQMQCFLVGVPSNPVCPFAVTVVSVTFPIAVIVTSFSIARHAHNEARLEYDVHRHEAETLRQQANSSAESIAVADRRCEAQKEKYERLKEDVRVKMTLLEENRLKVMRKQLLLLHNALMTYFSGNAKALQSTMDQLGADANDANSGVAPSFLEQ
ncbi:Uncharacterized protein F54C8.7 [Toxocara canis]|uniref:Uncharacterized protein F54C8.7 n=1 Tax=Toxocara canis TaxID=6265 RepID=A0A0B2VAW9_TOXCA|nr:Uncharacterized protein F54C8.7 [Toxocara canis]